MWNVSDEFWFVSNKHDEVSPFHSGENRYPGFVIPAKDKPKSNPHGKSTTLKAIVKYLNGLSRKQIKEFAKQDSVPMNRRLSLMVFIRDWRVDDPTHEEYLRGVAEGHSTDEALQAGDLLNFLMIGGAELQVYKADEFVPSTRWTEYLGPFLEKVPATRGVEHLIGVHDAVLGMLPMKTYNHYTIAEVFADHPDLKTAMLGEPVLLAPIEFKALASLQNIVDSGSIGQFKLALSKGSNKGISKLAEARGGDIGGIVLSAFKLAQAAVGAFKTGDYKTAKELMDDLQRQYGIGAGSFASVEEYMFIATLSSPRKFTKNPSNGRFGIKGNPRQVLLALDTTFNTDANDNATPARRAMAARIVAQENAWSYTNNKTVDRTRTHRNYGTNGFRNFVVEHSTGNNNRGGGGGKNTAVSVVSTDWLAIFYAIANAESVVDTSLKPLLPNTISDVYNEVFTIKSFGIEGFEAGTSSKNEIEPSKIKKYFNDTLNLSKEAGWGKYDKNKGKGRANWDFNKLSKDYSFEDHPDLYKKGGGKDITPFQGNEPMYRFLVYSDLQAPTQSILGNFNPKGTLTVILRATSGNDAAKDWLPFEADMFYESFYSGDDLDKLLPSVSQEGKEDDPINLQQISMSNRARSRPARNPPSDAIVPIYAGEPKGVKENLGAIFSEIVIGRNVVKDVGEVVQSIYRGLVGGRTSMAEKRMAMAVASMQKELSDRAIEAGGNAIANLKMDYEMIDGSATLTVMAHADAIVLPANKVKKNPFNEQATSFKIGYEGYTDEEHEVMDRALAGNIQPGDLAYYSWKVFDATGAHIRSAESEGGARWMVKNLPALGAMHPGPWTYERGERIGPSLAALRSQGIHLGKDMVYHKSRQARKKSSSKKPSSGNMISIELTPRSQVQLSTVVDKADWYKAAEHPIGFLQIGGGIAGDFPICVVPMIRQDLQEEAPLWGWFAQISESTASYGGYSGAPPSEKITWGKLAPETPMHIIESDATIVAPILFAYILN